MILTCPRCATRFFVDDAQIWAAGRVVKCAECGDRWTARPAPPPPPPALTDSAPPVGEADQSALFARLPQARPARRIRIPGGRWTALAVVLALTIAAMAVLRPEVVRLWPGAAGLYARMGLAMDRPVIAEPHG